MTSDLIAILRQMHADLEEAASNLAWTAIDGRFHYLLKAAKALEAAQAEIELLTEDASFGWQSADEAWADNAKLRAVVDAAKMFSVLARTRVWEDASMNACGMKGGDSSDVHALRELESRIAALDTGE